ncbi:actin-domain-containing protein [Atractiella rhizophila]|nr:actin-domain-containing protein [Atractiella rhizophila]
MDLVSPLLIFDNGASSIKHTVVQPGTKVAPSATICSNALTRSKLFPKRTFIGSQLEKECDDFAGLTYRLPFEKGILRDWEVQKKIWDWVVLDGKITTTDTDLLLTEPPLNLPNVQESYDQMVFEEFGFQSYWRGPSALLAGWYPAPLYGKNAKQPLPPPSGVAEQKKKGKRKSKTATAASQQDIIVPECALVIDAGYSFTHIVPVVQGRVVGRGVRRIDVGGKLLTNHLKELVSFRQWYMMDQTYVMNVVKERCCFVALDFPGQLRSWKANPSSVVQQYVLPDFTPSQTKDAKTSLGYILQSGEKPLNIQGIEKPDQVLIMGNERFAIPEVLFNPELIGLDQMGISDCVADVIEGFPEEYRGMLWDNIICIGGSSQFPGFRDRLMTDLRPLAPSEYDINICLPPNPTTASFDSAAALLTSPRAPSLLQNFVTKEEYGEWGSNICYRRFGRFAGLAWIRDIEDDSTSLVPLPALPSETTDVEEAMEVDADEEKELEILDQYIDATEKALLKTRQGNTLDDDRILDWEKNLSEKSSSSDEESEIGTGKGKKRRKSTTKGSVKEKKSHKRKR